VGTQRYAEVPAVPVGPRTMISVPSVRIRTVRFAPGSTRCTRQYLRNRERVIVVTTRQTSFKFVIGADPFTHTGTVRQIKRICCQKYRQVVFLGRWL